MFLEGHKGIIEQSYFPQSGAGRNYLEKAPASELIIWSMGVRGEELLVRPLSTKEAAQMVEAREATIVRTMPLVLADWAHAAGVVLGMVRSVRPSDKIWVNNGMVRPVLQS
jgi:hypothetical protein